MAPGASIAPEFFGLAYVGLFLVYTYIALSFDRATGGDARVLAGLLLLWGVALTIGNLAAGRLTDRLGSRRIINVTITVVAVDHPQCGSKARCNPPQA
jgi:predicted MFS family arabinose efflux permease